MIDVRLRELAARQDDVVAVWQLTAVGWSKHAVLHRTAGLRRLHDGVFLIGSAPATKRQRRRAASLTSPDTFLAYASAADHWGYRTFDGSFETVVRPGSGGRERIGDLLVTRSTTLDGNTTTHRGLPTTTPERTVIDLAAHLDDRELRKTFREALRLKRLTSPSLLGALDAHRGRRGVEKLRALAQKYARLQIERCRSDAEAMALELIDEANLPQPNVNKRVAGEEADLSWPAWKLIVELDGPQFHRLKDEDARKTAAWRKAGWIVRRISTDAPFTEPAMFLDVCRTAFPR